MLLQKYLTENKITAAEFAKTVGLTRQAVNNYINGRRFPKHDILKKILLATGGAVSANDFL